MATAAIMWGDLLDQLPSTEQDCISSALGDELLREVRQSPISPDEPQWGPALFECLTPDTALSFPGAMLFSLMVNEVLLGTAGGDEIPPETKECIGSLLADTDVGAILATAMQDPTSGQMPNQAIMDFAAGLESCAPQIGGMTGPPDSGHPMPSADSILWQHNVAGWALNAPALSDGVVYVGADDAKVYALNAETGEQLWNFETGDVVRSPAIVSDGIVYVGSNDNNLYALDAETGNLMWQHDTDDQVRYAPLVSSGLVYVPTISEGGRNLHALDAASGTQLWVASQYYPFDTGFESGIGAASDGDILLVIGDSGELHALDAQTGDLAWSFRGEVGTDTPPVIVGNLVYVTAVNTAYALDLLTGEELWKYGTERFPARGFAPVIDGGAYYFSPDDYVYALDTMTGQPIWTYQLDDLARTAPVVADSFVYVASESGRFHAIDIQTGELRWSIDAMTDTGFLESPAVDDGVLYLESSDGYLLALDAQTSDELWGFSKGFFSGVRTYTLADGAVYFSSLNGAIYALDASAAAMR
jgi:outer membrane protein assembly factor BamB